MAVSTEAGFGSDGRVAGRYRLVEPIGSGGMGRVYRAHDEVLDREVAVKLLDERAAAGADLGVAYAEEARAAARLTHPGIARVYDSGLQNGRCFVVMELVPGQLLAEVLHQRQTLPPLEAAELAAQVADALEAAHQQGIIHCDVKPQNIIVTPDGTPKLVDFGIARAANAASTVQTAELFGSVAYLAPEQARGERLDARTDVYALGSVLYELLTSRPPWTGGSAADIIAQKLVGEPPSPRSVDATIPPEVEQAVVTALARDPARRYQSAGAFRDALRAAVGNVASVAQTRTIPIVRVPRVGGTTARLPWLRTVGMGLAAAVMLLVLGAVLVTASASRSAPPEQVAPPAGAPTPSGTSIQLTAPATAAPVIQPTAQSTVAPIIEPVPRLLVTPVIPPADPPRSGGGSPRQDVERKAAEEAKKKADDERKKAQDDAKKKADDERRKPQEKGSR